MYAAVAANQTRTRNVVITITEEVRWQLYSSLRVFNEHVVMGQIHWRKRRSRPIKQALLSVKSQFVCPLLHMIEFSSKTI